MLNLLTFSCQVFEGWPMAPGRCNTQIDIHIPAEWGIFRGNVSGIDHFRNCWFLPISLSCNISGIESEWSICHSHQLEAIYADWKCPGKSASAIDGTRGAKLTWSHSHKILLGHSIWSGHGAVRAPSPICFMVLRDGVKPCENFLYITKLDKSGSVRALTSGYLRLIIITD